MKALTEEKIVFVRETVLTLKLVKILKERGFVVCFKEVNEWNEEIYSIYA